MSLLIKVRWADALVVSVLPDDVLTTGCVVRTLVPCELRLVVQASLVDVPGAARARAQRGLGGRTVAAAESFIPLLWPFGFYGLFYWAGWQLFGRESALTKLQPYFWLLAVVGLALFVPYYIAMPELNIEVAKRRATWLPPGTLWLEAVLTAYLSVLLTLVAMLFGQRYLSSHSFRMRFIADSSYWVYLVHLPIVLLLQTWLVPLDWNVWLKLTITTLVTLVACLATYVVFVRYTPVGWLLNGKRHFLESWRLLISRPKPQGAGAQRLAFHPIAWGYSP